MDEDSQFRRVTAWAVGATGVGGLVAFFSIGTYGALIILVLALLLFGGYLLWRRIRARRQRERFSSALEAQTAAAPKAISDPNQRADLDRVRQKFQKGLQEFKSRGKNIYKLPWYVIIGESGSGKTEAIRHSGIDFPPGLQDELQGSGGTVNMDWWFTNRAIVLDTAGSMIFNQSRAGEAPEWREFLRLLKRARPHCPINGLFLVLSVESFIRDSAETIKDKASHLAQQLDLIQRTLDVRFPVYLLVTKCDLLIGFREFFDSIDDPLLQHQMFGWSNPEPLDAHFRPDLVEQHLKSVAERLRRRRLALLRTASGGAGGGGDTSHFLASSYQLGRSPAGTRRLDEVDALFALPESVMRLAPRLRRYLETVFVAGEWSAKPVFLRGIYFTSSMREGKALDEAIAFATGLPLDQLPEDRSWEKNRAFFLRDLFVEKVFRESGLVTRATNTLKLLRQRQLAIFGAVGAALLLLLVFAWFAKDQLDKSVSLEADLWQAGADKDSWRSGVWLPGSIINTNEPFKLLDSKIRLRRGKELSIAQFHQELMQRVAQKLSAGWFFAPVSSFGKSVNARRSEAQALLLESALLKPLIFETRAKLQRKTPTKPTEMKRHADAWLSLVQLEADKADPSATFSFISPDNGERNVANNLGHFLAYLTENDTNKLDPKLVQAFLGTFGGKNREKGIWPPYSLLGGDTLTTNRAIGMGLTNYNRGCLLEQTNLSQELSLLDNLVDQLGKYHQKELEFLKENSSSCLPLNIQMPDRKKAAETNLAALETAAGHAAGPLTNLAMRYSLVASNMSNTSVSTLLAHVKLIQESLPKTKTSHLVQDVLDNLNNLAVNAGSEVMRHFFEHQKVIEALDRDCLPAISTNASLAFQARWDLYTNACALASTRYEVTDRDIGISWNTFTNLSSRVQGFRKDLAGYKGRLETETRDKCDRIAQSAVGALETNFLSDYVTRVRSKLNEFTDQPSWDIEPVTNVSFWFRKIQDDLDGSKVLGSHATMVENNIREPLRDSRRAVLIHINESITRGLKFPVLLAAPPADPMGMPDLSRLRSLLAGLPKVLQQDPGWTNDSPAQLRSLQESVDRYFAVVTSLVETNGAAVEGKIYFVPPVQGTEDDQFRRIFKGLRISIGTNSVFGPDDLSHSPSLLGSVSVDSALDIAFNRSILGLAPSWKTVSYTNFWLPRLIRDARFNGKPLEDGLKWRFQFRPEGALPIERGNLVFEVVLPRPLVWRQSK